MSIHWAKWVFYLKFKSDLSKTAILIIGLYLIFSKK